MGASNWIHLEVEKIVRETDAAFSLRVDGEDYWIPKSQISDPEDFEAGDENVTVSVTEWIARQKGLDG